jgi:hypothetical protein
VEEWQEKGQIASKKYDDLNRKLQGYFFLFSSFLSFSFAFGRKWVASNCLDSLRVDEDEELEPLPIIPADELDKHHKDEVVRRIAELEEAVGKMKPNMNAIREFRKKDAEYQVCIEQNYVQFMLIILLIIIILFCLVQSKGIRGGDTTTRCAPC